MRIKKRKSLRTILYTCWRHMWQRCHNKQHKQYVDYGGRGIYVCPRWADFDSFLEDMQGSWYPGSSIERKNNNAGYHPKNCRWATPLEQQLNTRVSITEEQKRKIWIFSDAGWKYQDIADFLGIGFGSVQRAAKRRLK